MDLEREPMDEQEPCPDSRRNPIPSEQASSWETRITELAARSFGRAGFTPNAVTILGGVLMAGVGPLVAQGWFLIAGIGLWLFAWLDHVDGTLARLSAQETRFGSFLDSMFDRLSEAVVFLGLLLWYGSAENMFGIVLSYLGMVSTLMVGYARSIAAEEGFSPPLGVMPRERRLATLSIGLILGSFVREALDVSLGLIVLLSLVTIIQRSMHVYTSERSDRRTCT